MAYLMIGALQQNKAIIGYRIFDTESKDGKFVDAPVDNIKDILMNKKARIVNLGLQDGNIASVNGSIERYPKLARNGILLNAASPLIVMTQIEDGDDSDKRVVGYRVVDYKGTVKKLKTSDVVEYAKKNGIANGKVVQKDNIEFISSIVGNYEPEKNTSARLKNIDHIVDNSMLVKTDTRDGSGTVAKHTEVDIDNAIFEEDVFDSMTDDQKKVVEAYYIWYTVEKYKALAKHIYLGTSVAKAEKLSEIRGEEKWLFGGTIDYYLRGKYNEHCELGHSIRYGNIAIPESDQNNKDAYIIFGSGCAAEFFKISPEDMLALNKTRRLMSEEIKLIAEMLANNQENLFLHKIELLYAIIRKLETKEAIIAAFGNRVGYALLSFIYVRIPIPMSLVIECTKEITKNSHKFFTTVFPEYMGTLDNIFGTDIYKPGLYGSGKEYLSFVADNKIEGDYAYNPLDDASVKRRDIGNYDKVARANRDRLLQRIARGAMCRDFNYDELTTFLDSIQILESIHNGIIDGMNNLGLMDKYEYRIASEAKTFVENGVSPEDKKIKCAIFNSTLLIHNSNVYCRPLTCDGNMIKTQLRIKDLHADLMLAKEFGIDKLVNEFCSMFSSMEAVNNKERQLEKQREQERIEQEAQRREAERKETERKEAERKEAERKEAERRELERLETEHKENEDKAKENTRKAAKTKINKPTKISENAAKKDAVDSADKIEQLKQLMKAHPEIAVEGGIETAQKIMDQGKPYDELSARQKWRIDDTIKIYEQGKVINNVYTLTDHPEIKQKVDRIIGKADDVEMKAIIELYPNMINIAYTIVKHNKASDKQMKYIDKAIEMLDQA